MSYQLFYNDDTAAMCIRVLLEELDQPYQLITTDTAVGVKRAPELLALNPNGWIPVLLWEGGAIYECGAITTFLCDRHPQFNLIPAIEHADRGLFLQWLFFFSSSVQNAFQMSYYPFRFCHSKADEASVRLHAQSRLRELLQVVNDAIGDRDTMLESGFSALDVYLFMLTTWLTDGLGHPPVKDFANINRLAEAATQRPAIQLVYRDIINNTVS